MALYGAFDPTLDPTRLGWFDSSLAYGEWFDPTTGPVILTVLTSRSVLGAFDSKQAGPAWFDPCSNRSSWFDDFVGPDDFPTLSSLPVSMFFFAPFQGSPWLAFAGLNFLSAPRSLAYTAAVPAPTIGAAVNGRASAYFDSTATGLLDLTTLVLSGYWPTAYSGSPNVGVATAGTSLGNDMSPGATGWVAPTIGATLNGFATMSFDGSTMGMVSGYSVANTVGTTAWSYAVLLNMAALAVRGSDYTNPALFTDDASIIGVTISDGGVAAFTYDSGAGDHETTPLIVVATSTWVLVQARWDGTTLGCRVNNGTWSTATVSTQYSGIGTTIYMGKSGYSSLNGLKAIELFAKNVAWSDAVANNIGAAIQAKYSLSLGF